MTATSLILLPGLDGTTAPLVPFVAAAPDGVVPIPVAYPSHLAAYDELEPTIRDKLVDNCVILAESFSGPLGVRLARDPRVQGLILCNSFILPPRPSFLRHLVIDSLLAVRPPRWLIRRCLLGKGAPPALLEQVREAVRQVPRAVLARRLRQVLACDERDALSGLAKPILYLRGTHDLLVRARSVREITGLARRAQVAEIAGPHLLLQVKPRPCWDAILAFLAIEGL